MASPARSQDRFDALYRAAMASCQRGSFQEGVDAFRAALDLNPRSCEARTGLGYALQALGRSEDALNQFDQAVSLQPRHAVALNGRGLALAALGRREQALAGFDAALQVNEHYVDALYHRGNVLVALEQPEAALDSYGLALRTSPNHVLSLNNRGNVLCALGRHEQAIADYQRALQLQPDFIDAAFNQAIALQALRRYEAALSLYDRIIAAVPDHARACVHRAYALLALNRPQEAQSSCSIALSIGPTDARTLICAGDVLGKLLRRGESRACYEQALQSRPDHPYLEGMALHASLGCCDWTGYEARRSTLEQHVREGRRSANPWEFATLSDSPADQLICARTTAEHRYPAAAQPLYRQERYRHDRIKVAYLSADFHEHATVCLMAGLFEQHDREKFEVIGVSFSPDRMSAMRTRVERGFDRFLDVSGLSDPDTARMLRELEVDIAVDLKGYTGDGRPGILACRPAPVQVNYLGYPGTLGADYIDYILADRIVLPEEQRHCYREKVAYLPHTYQVNDDRRSISPVVPRRADAGLPEDAFVFCSFNNNYKITPGIFDIWMRTLGRIENSVLWLFLGSDEAALNLRNAAQQRGIAAERLVFAPRVSMEDHLARHRLADLFLDTLPCNAHTTASDALWSGLPILTCLGPTFAGRVCASLLHAIGLPQLVTDSLDAYEARAFELATDRPQMARLRQALAENIRTRPLFDTRRFARNIERAFTQMHVRHQAGDMPVDFTVRD